MRRDAPDSFWVFPKCTPHSFVQLKSASSRLSAPVWIPNMLSLTPDASKPVLVLPHFSADRKSHTSSHHFASSMQNFSFAAARHSRPVRLIGPHWPDFCRNV